MAAKITDWRIRLKGQDGRGYFRALVKPYLYFVCSLFGKRAFFPNKG
jgi:hypothetical protein